MKLTRTMVISVAIFAAIVGGASAQDSDVVDDRLVAAWNFDGSAASSAGQRDARLTARKGRGGPSGLRFVEAAEVPGTLTVYLNGRRTGTARFDGSIGTLKDGLGIGDSSDMPSAGSRFRGYVDEITIWSRALSAEEIQAPCRVPERIEALRQSELARKRLRQERIEAELAQRAAAVGQLKELGVEEIVFAQRGHGRDLSEHYYANFGYSCIDPNVWFHADDGGKLSKLNLPTGRLIDLVDDPAGSVRDPQVHYDGGKILFSYRTGGTHRYQVNRRALFGNTPESAWKTVGRPRKCTNA